MYVIFLQKNKKRFDHEGPAGHEKRFPLAEEKGLAEKLFEWRMKLYPSDDEDCMNAWNKAKKRLGR